MEALQKNIVAVLESVEDCLRKQRPLPALILLYSAMDAVAGLERKPSRSAFVNWVNTYMQIPCTALELYAARCGVVHSFSAYSDLYREGKVRSVLYAWGAAESSELQAAINLLPRRNNSVAVHVQQLVAAFRRAVLCYLEELGQDSRRLNNVKANSAWFVDIAPETVRQFVASSGKAP